MNAFRLLLGLICGTIGAYTVYVAMEHGMGLFPIFFGDIAEGTWPGQFNLDFLGMLLLSGFWMAWRNNFTPGGLVLGVAGVFLGAPMLALYLWIVSQQTNGDVARMLLGDKRANAEP